MSSIKLPEIMQRLQKQQDSASSTPDVTPNSASGQRRRRRRSSSSSRSQNSANHSLRRRSQRGSQRGSRRGRKHGSRRIVNVGFALIGLLLLLVLGLGLYRYASVNSLGYARQFEQKLEKQFSASKVSIQDLALVPGKLSAARVTMEFEQGWVQKLDLQGLECEISWLDMLLGNWNGEFVRVNQAEVQADGVWSMQQPAGPTRVPRTMLQQDFKFKTLQAGRCNFSWSGVDGSPLLGLGGSSAICQLHGASGMSLIFRGGQLQSTWWQQADLLHAELGLGDNRATLKAELDFRDKKPLLFEGALRQDGDEYLQLSASSADGDLATLTRGRWDWLLQAHLKDYQYRLQLFGNGALQYDLRAQADAGELKASKVLQQFVKFTTNKNYTQPKLLAPFKLHLQSNEQGSHILNIPDILEPGFLSLNGTLQMDFAGQLKGTLNYGLPQLIVQRGTFGDDSLGFLPAQNGFCHLPVNYSGSLDNLQITWPQKTLEPTSSATSDPSKAALTPADREKNAMEELGKLLEAPAKQQEAN